MRDARDTRIEKGEVNWVGFGLGHEGRAMRENGAKGDEGK